MNNKDIKFEGPEKRLHMIFDINDNSLRNINKNIWSELLKIANCTIISKIENKYYTLYLLSESSLIINDNSIILKTCGTTKPLNIVDNIVSILEKENIKLISFMYYHRKFLYPELQPYPYYSMEDEIKVIKEIIKDEIKILSLNNNWQGIYYIDKSKLQEDDNNSSAKAELITDESSIKDIKEITMTGIDIGICKYFYKENQEIGKKIVTDIIDIKDNDNIDYFQFEPCGVSVNIIKDDEYGTIHITPEENCSYISYESNTNFNKQNWIDLFKPKEIITIEIRNYRNLELPISTPNNSIYPLSGYKFIVVEREIF